MMDWIINLVLVLSMAITSMSLPLQNLLSLNRFEQSFACHIETTNQAKSSNMPRVIPILKAVDLFFDRPHRAVSVTFQSRLLAVPLRGPWGAPRAMGIPLLPFIFDRAANRPTLRHSAYRTSIKLIQSLGKSRYSFQSSITFDLNLGMSNYTSHLSNLETETEDSTLQSNHTPVSLPPSCP